MANSIFSMYVLGNGQYQKLDVDAVAIQTTFSLEEIKDVSKRNDNISKSITLKGTKGNNLIFGALYNVDRLVNPLDPVELFYNYKPNKYIDCIVLENNIQIIKGRLLIVSVDIKEGFIYYNCTIVGEVVSFFSNMQDRVLTELDSFRGYNAILDKTNIEASWNNDYTLPYIMPTIDYGYNSYMTNLPEGTVVPENDSRGWWGNGLDVGNIRPAVWLKSYLDAIFKGFRYDEANDKWTQYEANNTTLLNTYQWESSLKNDAGFKRLFIPHNEAKLSKTIQAKTMSFDGGTRNNAISKFSLAQNTLTEYSPPDSTGFKRINANWTVADSVTGTPVALSTKVINGQSRLVFNFTQATKAVLEIRFTLTSSLQALGQTYVTLHKMPNDGQPYSMNMDNEVMSQRIRVTSAGGSTSHTLKIEDSTLDGMYYLGVYSNSSSVLGLRAEAIVYSSESRPEIDVIYGDTVNLVDALPKEVPVKDLLRGVMTLFNLYMIQDRDNPKKFIIEPFNEFYKDIITLDTDKAINWSDKVDFQSYNINSNLDLPKSYTYKYRDDGDWLNELYRTKHNKTFGSYSINDSEGLQSPKIVESFFSPTITYSRSDLKVPTLPAIYKTEGLGLPKVTMKSNLRLLYYSGNMIHTYKVFSGIGTVSYDYERYTLVGMSWFEIILNATQGFLDTRVGQMYASLEFGRSNEYWSIIDIPTTETNKFLYARFHSTQMLELVNDNLVTMDVSVYLNEDDIYRLDFRVPIYIQTPNGGAYFKLLKVDYTNNSTKAKVLLQKIV